MCADGAKFSPSAGGHQGASQPKHTPALGAKLSKSTSNVKETEFRDKVKDLFSLLASLACFSCMASSMSALTTVHSVLELP